MNEGIALEVATVLLMLESALAEARGSFGAGASLRSRLQDCIQASSNEGSGHPLLDEMSRKAAERLVMNQVSPRCSQSASHRTSARCVLPRFYEARRARVARQTHASAARRSRCWAKRAPRRLSESPPRKSAGFRTDRRTNRRISSASLRLFRAWVSTSRPGARSGDFEAPCGDRCAAEEESDAARQAPSVEAHIAEQQRETAGVYEEWKDKPEDAHLRAELKKNLAPCRKTRGWLPIRNWRPRPPRR